MARAAAGLMYETSVPVRESMLTQLTTTDNGRAIKFCNLKINKSYLYITSFHLKQIRSTVASQVIFQKRVCTAFISFNTKLSLKFTASGVKSVM